MGHPPRRPAHQQGHRDIERLAASPTGDLPSDGLQALGNDQDGPDLRLDQHRLGAPQQPQLEMVVDQPDRQFNIPAPGIQLDEVGGTPPKAGSVRAT